MGDPEIPRNNIAHRAQPYGLKLCKAAITNDWPAAAAIFHEFPDAIRERITCWGETALHLAVGSNRSHNFVAKLTKQILIVDPLVLGICTESGNNVLHYAANAGNFKDAMVLVEEDPTMTLVYNFADQTPLHIAAACGRHKTSEYLLTKTEMAQAAQPTNWRSSPFSEMMGLKLVVSVIEAEFYDLALKLLKKYPRLATQEADEKSALTTLATKQTRFGYCRIGRPLNRMIRLMSKNPAPEKEMVIFICNTIIDKAPIHAERMIKRGIFAAIENGTYEFIKECLIRYPITLWSRNDVLELFISSIKYRQEAVFNELVRYTTPHDTLLINGWEYEGGNVLHLVAHLPRYDVQLARAQTAMHLQITREVRWYQAVERMIDGPAKKALNREGKTSRMVFLEEHKDMNQKVGDWAIQVAAAGTVVAALVFTASINSLLNQSGPRSKNVTADTHSGQTHRSAAFLIYNALAFGSSTFSMILFMSILTKRYNEGGILTCMPRTLNAGVIALYQSIFCVTLMAIIMMAPEKSKDYGTFKNVFGFVIVVLGVVFNGQALFLIGLPNYGRLKSSGI